MTFSALDPFDMNLFYILEPQSGSCHGRGKGAAAGWPQRGSVAFARGMRLHHRWVWWMIAACACTASPASPVDGWLVKKCSMGLRLSPVDVDEAHVAILDHLLQAQLLCLAGGVQDGGLAGGGVKVLQGWGARAVARGRWGGRGGGGAGQGKAAGGVMMGRYEALHVARQPCMWDACWAGRQAGERAGGKAEWGRESGSQE